MPHPRSPRSSPVAARALLCALLLGPVVPQPLQEARRQEARRQAAEAILTEAASHGLTPDDYAGADPLDSRLARYLIDLSRGRVDPQAAGFDLSPPGPRPDIETAIRYATTAAELRAIASDLEPRWWAYGRLRAALAHYRDLSRRTLAPVPTPQHAVHEGDAYDSLDALVQRLYAEGDLAPLAQAPAPLVMTPAIVEGLRRFQARHALDADGVLGRRTSAALQVPLATRAGQIARAMEWYRWISGYDATDLVVVNIPTSTLAAYPQEAADAPPVLTSRVIVGAARTPTPVFSAMLTQVILRPYWNVPVSIAHGELLPRARRDPGYLQRNHYEIVRGDSDRSPVLPMSDAALALVARGGARLRQRPGAHNALGFLKFDLPNSHSVYLHDTPGRSLFERTIRTLSHGCVRVENPDKLAAWILRDTPWTHARIVDGMMGETSSILPVPRSVRVILMYATAAIADDGRVRFAPDVYRRDGW